MTPQEGNVSKKDRPNKITKFTFYYPQAKCFLVLCFNLELAQLCRQGTEQPQQKETYRMNHLGSNFLGGSFSNRGYVRTNPHPPSFNVKCGNKYPFVSKEDKKVIFFKLQ